MNRSSWGKVCLVVALLALVLAVGACDEKKDDKKSAPTDGEAPDPLYDLSMRGWAFGDGLYRYEGGRWNKDTATTFSARMYGALFASEEFGYVYGLQRIYRYSAGSWIGVADTGSLPPGAIGSATFTPDGTAWFAVNDPYDVGYLVKVAAEGAPTNIPTQGVISSVPIRVVSVFTVPGDAALHMLAVVPEAGLLFYQHLRWDGVTKTSETLFEIPFREIGPPLPTDDDTAPDDDDDDDDNDDDSTPELQQMVELHDMKSAADGTIWTAGWVRADDGTPFAALWYRVPGETVTWQRMLLSATTGCRTTSVEKIVFSPDNRQYLLAECGPSQIYRRDDAGEFREMFLPGVKGSTYRIHGLSLLSDTQGWAVGYSSDLDGPMLLLRNADGWELAHLQSSTPGDELYDAAVFAIPQPGGIGEPDDDTVADDDTTADDDAVDDDTTTPDDDTSAG